MSILLLVLLLSAPEAFCRQQGDTGTVLVNTTLGPIRGLSLLTEDGVHPGQPVPMHLFLGIPYAKPPLAELRLEKPQKPKRWTEPRDTVEAAPSCWPMHPKDMWVEPGAHSEDCLYLNLYAPPPPGEGDSPSLFPVLVYIHGGGFQSGSIRDLSAPMFAKYVREGIVVAAMQYRTGPLGFAATGDESFAGNYGLWDQTLALQFVRDNVRQIGGDPDKVTVWGFSAGAASVSHLSVSPHSNTLFRSAYQQSGTSMAEWALSNRVTGETERLAAALGCGDALHSSVELKKCLKRKSVHEMFDGIDKIGRGRREVNFLKFTPRLDADFFPDDLVQLLERSPPKRLLTGVTREEGLMFTLFLLDVHPVESLVLQRDQWTQFGRQQFEQFIADAVTPERVFGKQAAEKARKRIMDFYAGEKEQGKGRGHAYWLDKYTEMVSDLMFRVPMLLDARLKAAAGWPVHMYQIDYFNREFYPDEVPVKGAMHASELFTLFGIQFPYVVEKPSAADSAFREVLVAMIVNFVKSGDPSSTMLPNWPALSTQQPFQYALLNDRPSVGQQLAPERLEFWQRLSEEFAFDFVRGFQRETLRNKDEL